MWREELFDLLKQVLAVNDERDTDFLEGFIVHQLETLSVNLIVLECSAELALFDGHKPLADIGDCPGERIACGGA